MSCIYQGSLTQEPGFNKASSSKNKLGLQRRLASSRRPQSEGRSVVSMQTSLIKSRFIALPHWLPSILHCYLDVRILILYYKFLVLS